MKTKKQRAAARIVKVFRGARVDISAEDARALWQDVSTRQRCPWARLPSNDGDLMAMCVTQMKHAEKSRRQGRVSL